jgi:hypothetical protein
MNVYALTGPDKSDLEYEREVKWDEVAELAHEWGCTYIEASAVGFPLQCEG